MAAHKARAATASTSQQNLELLLYNKTEINIHNEEEERFYLSSRSLIATNLSRMSTYIVVRPNELGARILFVVLF
jgi:hypothetical protein